MKVTSVGLLALAVVGFVFMWKSDPVVEVENHRWERPTDGPDDVYVWLTNGTVGRNDGLPAYLTPERAEWWQNGKFIRSEPRDAWERTQKVKR